MSPIFRSWAGSLLVLGSIAAVTSEAAAAESKSWVMSWFVPAMYAHEGDCTAIDPVLLPGRSAIDSMYYTIFLQLGKSPEEADKLITDFKEGTSAEVGEMLINRGRVNGKPVNVFQNPESIPDPKLHTVTGKYAIGFNLDGKGAGEPGSFEDPYTHEQGVDNQYYRAIGCSRSSRVVAPEKSSHWEDVWHFNIDKAPALLITVEGENLRKDGDVTVTFNRTIERTRNDALSKVRRDMTFRTDPSPLNRSVLRGKIKDGTLIVEGGQLKFGGKFATVPFDLANVHLRFKIKADGSLDGLLAGYQPWRTIYHFYYGYYYGTEAAFGINIPGVYHALKRLADADPDPITGQNQRISVTYGLQAVPAFLAPEGRGTPLLTASVADSSDKAVPMATPIGITVQVPGGQIISEYRPRSVEIQYYADARGMALYTFEKDLPNQSSCYEDCALERPPLIAYRGATAFGDWSLVRRKDGRKQWAFQGKPLYTFAKDSVIGEPTGAPKPQDPYERSLNAFLNKKDHAESASANPLWQLALYQLAQPSRPHGIAVSEVLDANGEVLVDVAGKTLYTFDGSPDSERSSCGAAPCTEMWGPLAAALLANPVGDFSLINRSDGIRQWAYKGRGLYKFNGDLEAGHAKGIGLDKRWRVALVRQFYMPGDVHIRESFGRGKVLTDGNGMTLYRRTATRTFGLARSVPVRPEEGRIIGARSCDSQCMKTWIPFDAPADATPAGFWEVLTQQNGKKQWSYKGYALYRYAGDEEPGDVKGSLIYELANNPQLETKPSALAQVATSIKANVDVPLIWSHMYP